MTVNEIVNEYLKANGYDGLYNPDGECACKVGTLASCGGPCDECEPGYGVPCPHNCGEHLYHIVAKKPSDKPHEKEWNVSVHGNHEDRGRADGG